ncbi:hypothetical protein ES695_19865 [Candidatus Atribacteria bacterium 1244-E10-H5-B2]|nr:MAG: hypothetical protein ES695_19865 [Candidatus Atribacteria bacterium 1244-E10-H5-B2]
MKRFSLNYDLFLSGFITFIGLAGLVYLHFEELSMGAGIGAKLFPQLSLLIMFIFGVLMVVDALGVKHAVAYPEINILSIALFVTLSILYVLFLTRIGIITATFLFLLVSFSILAPEGKASLKSSIIYSAFLTFFIWIIFVRIIGIILPQGLLI